MKTIALMALLGAVSANELADEKYRWCYKKCNVTLHGNPLCWHNCTEEWKKASGNTEEDVEEDIKVLYPWKDVKEYGRQVDAMGDTLMSPAAIAKRKQFMAKMNQVGNFWAKEGPKYLPELKAYGESDIVKKVHAAEARIMRTKEWRDFVDDLEDLGEDMMEADAGKKPTKQGWYEWIDNDDLADIAEDVQDVIRSFKRLARSRAVAEKNRLGMKSLSNPHAVKVWQMFKKDMQVKSLEHLGQKLANKLKMMRAMAKKCPVHQKMKAQIIRLMKTIERTRKVWDMPTAAQYNRWESKHPWPRME